MAKPSKLEQLVNHGIGTFETKVVYRSGYILNAFEQNDKFDALVIPMNCHNACGVGILRASAEKYPEAKAKLDLTPAGAQNKMGNILSVDLDMGKTLVYVFCSIGFNKSTMPKRLWDNPGVNLKSLRISLIATLSRFDSVCLPSFGMGMFPTDWSTIEGVLDDVIDHYKAKGKEKTITVFR